MNDGCAVVVAVAGGRCVGDSSLSFLLLLMDEVVRADTAGDTCPIVVASLSTLDVCWVRVMGGSEMGSAVSESALVRVE